MAAKKTRTQSLVNLENRAEYAEALVKQLKDRAKHAEAQVKHLEDRVGRAESRIKLLEEALDDEAMQASHATKYAAELENTVQALQRKQTSLAAELDVTRLMTKWLFKLCIARVKDDKVRAV